MITEFLGPAAGGAGKIDFVQFASTLHKNMGGWSDAYGDAYDMIDVEKKGTLDRAQLQGFMSKLGERLTDEEAGACDADQCRGVRVRLLCAWGCCV